MLTVALAVIVAQQVLPNSPPISGGVADPREPRVAIGVIRTNLFADPLADRPGQGFPTNADLAHDAQGVVQLGTNMPLLRTGPVVFSLQGGVASRFRLESRDKDLFSIDYVIALPAQWERGPYSARVRLVHRSSHLGDELVSNTTIRRIEFTHEEADLLVARRFGPVRAYGGGALTLSSYFPYDKHGVQLGADGQWQVARSLSVVAGVDWQKHSISRGHAALAALGGVQLAAAGGQATITLEYLGGATPLGEFFLERERYWGVSLRLSRSWSTGNRPVPI